MGESENPESDFMKVVTALFKDDIEVAVRNVVKNRIIPTMKKTASDSLKDLVDQMFHTGPTTPVIPAGSVANGQKTTAYNKMYVSGSNTPVTTIRTVDSSYTLPAANVGKTATSTTNFNGLPNYITVPTYQDAENIVNVMNDKIREEETASVNDLFDLAGKSHLISGNSAAPRYGWDNIDAHTITPMADGQYMLSMPPYKYLRKEN